MGVGSPGAGITGIVCLTCALGTELGLLEEQQAFLTAVLISYYS